MRQSTPNGIMVVSTSIGFVLLLCIPFFVVCIRKFLCRRPEQSIRDGDIDLEQRIAQDATTSVQGSRASSPSLMSPGEERRCHEWIASINGTHLLKNNSSSGDNAAPSAAMPSGVAESAQEAHEPEGSSVEILPATSYKPRRRTGRREIEGIFWLTDGTPYFVGFDGDHTRLHKVAKNRHSPPSAPQVYSISTNF